MAEIRNQIKIKDGTIYMSRPGYYFGFGIHSDTDAVEAIVGHPVIAELGVYAAGLNLVVQDLDQIPETTSDELGGKSAQQIIAESWSGVSPKSFSSYGLRASQNRSDLVKGTLYEIGMHDALALAHFDIAGPSLGDAAWRYWNHGLELSDGRQVMTLNIGHEQGVDRIVNGEAYDPFLNGKEATLEVIEATMEPFLKELND